MTAVLDLSPAPGAAPALRRVGAHARTEVSLLLRNGEQLLLALVIPVALVVAGHVVGDHLGPPAILVPSVLALAVWSSAFTSVAIATGFERRYGVLERLASTPLGRRGLLVGKVAALSAVVLLQLCVVAGAGALLGWRPAFSVLSALVAVAAVVLAVGGFCCLALVLAGRLRAEATLALANLIYVAFLAVGALLVPVWRYPEAVRPVLELLPTAALAETLRHACVGEVLWWPLAVLSGWLAVGVVGVSRLFRWTS
jgi:ABC-2 type transport system permease protein